MTAGSREGTAVVYCEGAFRTPNGKTAHGLVRFTRRYDVKAVVDSTCAGRDAGEILDGRPAGIPVVAGIGEAVALCRSAGQPATHLVVGLAPDGGRLGPKGRKDIEKALRAGLHVDSGLHDFLGEYRALSRLATKHGVRIRDIRRPPARAPHFYSGGIRRVRAPRIAVLGTDSAVGKRTTAWRLVDAFEAMGKRAELVGTGQTAWLQGVRYGILMDALVNDFVAGELEHAVISADKEASPDVIVIEGQGSLLHPAYPGGFEILATGRPCAIVLQHAPARKHYDGFPECPMDPIDRQVQALEIVGRAPVAALTLNHEGLDLKTGALARRDMTESTGLPVFDVLDEGADGLAKTLLPWLRPSNRKRRAPGTASR